ncbi:Glucokinase [Lacunisphaera limnophila]|uniref:Glucokinase n=1 Tax=Lacunisphaera limnophila TaxID=1838286 RepID=A0A1D8AWH3_9BACT|nr:ROK family protein [Lacunisphaera limnophila]AOS45231.1 Glucokinase [Lacunisphaera limnophila]
MSSPSQGIFLGTDSGATTSKTGGVWADGTIISTKLRQSSTNSQAGTAAVIKGWVDGVVGFLADNQLSWDQVKGVGLAIPGPYLGYGIMGRASNLPKSFEGWNFHADYSAAIAAAAGRAVPLVVGNDGNYGGVGEAQRVRGDSKATVLMLAPGSGLGVAYVDANGLPLEGDTLNGMEGGHMPAILQLLGGMKPLKCGCGRDWGCIEPYTTISGLPQLLQEFLPKHPTHPFHTSPAPIKEKAFSLRTLAQKGDPLAIDIFNFQAKALGLHMASLLVAVDAEYVVIGGGLIDPEATTPEFRERYLRIIRESALPYLWPKQAEKLKVLPATLGELSQAIGAALVALYTDKAKA